MPRLPPAPAWPKASAESTALQPGVGTRRRLSIDFMKPSVNRVGIRNTASSWVAVDTCPIRATASGPTRSPPPHDSGAYMPARPRAVATPLPPPNSAARYAREFGLVRARIMFFIAIAVTPLGSARMARVRSES
jgi:hypothetical protein